MSANDQSVMRQRWTRRQWLTRAGLLVSAGLLAACSPTAPPAAPTAVPAAPKPTQAPAPPTQAPAQTAPATGAQRGGSVVWALNSDPVNLIPYGAVPTQNMWGKEFMYDSLIAWDRNLAVQPALADRPVCGSMR